MKEFTININPTLLLNLSNQTYIAIGYFVVACIIFGLFINVKTRKETTFFERFCFAIMVALLWPITIIFTALSVILDKY